MTYDRVPDVAFLRIIGSIADVHKHKPTRSHAWTREQKGILLGHARYTKGCLIRILIRPPVTIVKTMHVTFAEDLNNSSNMLLSLPDRDGESYYLLRI